MKYEIIFCFSGGTNLTAVLEFNRYEFLDAILHKEGFKGIFLLFEENQKSIASTSYIVNLDKVIYIEKREIYD